MNSTSGNNGLASGFLSDTGDDRFDLTAFFYTLKISDYMASVDFLL
jgi:hypothetical protein